MEDDTAIIDRKKMYFFKGYNKLTTNTTDLYGIDLSEKIIANRNKM